MTNVPTPLPGVFYRKPSPDADEFAQPGDQVEEGQVIGFEGSTGWSTGCHLHFTVMANGVAVDPMNWL